MQRRVVDVLAESRSAGCEGFSRLILVALLALFGTLIWVAPPAVAQPSADCPAGTATYLYDAERTDRTPDARDIPIQSTIHFQTDYCFQTDGTATITFESFQVRSEYPPSHPDYDCSGQQTMVTIWDIVDGEDTATWSLDGNTLQTSGHERLILQGVVKKDCGGEVVVLGETTLQWGFPSFALEMTSSGGTLTGSDEFPEGTATVFVSATLAQSGSAPTSPTGTTAPGTPGATGTTPTATGPSAESGSGIPMAAAVAAVVAALGVGAFLWTRSRRSSSAD